jgi:hypothetical protein
MPPRPFAPPISLRRQSAHPAGARTLRAGGEAGIFTPMFYFKARKPADGKPARSSQTTQPSPKAAAAAARSRSRSRSRR